MVNSFNHSAINLLIHSTAGISICFQKPSVLLNQFQINILDVSLILLITILIGIIILLYSSKRRFLIRFYKIEQQLILSRINPHFIFNSLTAIQSYIFRNDPLQASKYLSSFAKLVRLTLESSRQEVTTIEQEIKILRLYFDLQMLRFEGKFSFTIEVDDSLNTDEFTIPPLLTLPFIESSIEHGFIQLSDKGSIVVRFINQKKFIIIEVEDNGIGIESAKLIHHRSGKSHQAKAKGIAVERLKKIWEINRLRIKMDVTDINSIDNSKHGSIVKFSIPNR
jgi:LytS/YehU family sensor histidine kinase